MAEDNNKKSERERNEKAKSIIAEKNIKMEDGSVRATGAAGFAKFFNNLVEEVVVKAQKEADKPRYRFLEDKKVFVACRKVNEEEKAISNIEERPYFWIVEKLRRYIIINKKTFEPVWFDDDLKILPKKDENLGDIVRLKSDKIEKLYECIYFDEDEKCYKINEPDNDLDNPIEHIIDTESIEYSLGDFDDIEFVPVRRNEFATVCNEIDRLEKMLHEYKYSVSVCENLDCTNVTTESRYYIRICKDNGIYVDIDLLKYEDDIKDFTFNEQDYIENKICRIEGSNSNNTKIVAEYAVDYLAHVIYFREFYTLIYNKIGWDYYDWDRTGWIFKYDKIYSNVGLLKGEARDNCAEGLECKKEMLDMVQRIGEESDAHLNVIYELNEEYENKVEELSQEEKVALIDKQYGEEFEWVGFTRKLINKHPYDALILGAGISGLIRQLLPYTKENNINVNIVGEPASGKSTICHYLLGIFGKPEKLEGSFTDTANSMEQIRIKRPILPYVLDERMLRIEGESEKAKAHTILMDIFREYEGKVKERLGKQYEENSGERTYGPIISSSVKSMMDYVFEADDLGQYRRFMEFDIGTQKSGTLFKDDEEAKKAESIAYKNYGYGIRIIVDYMLELLNGSDKDANIIIERFDKLDKEIENILTKREEEEKDVKVKGLSSSSKRFALIVLSYQILRESLNHYDIQMIARYQEENIDEIIKKIEKVHIDNTEEIINLLIDNLVLKMKKVKHKADTSTENNLYNYILNNASSFVEFTKGEYKFPKYAAKKVFNEKDKYIGFYEKQGDEIILYTIEKYRLNHFWYMEPIPTPEEILSYIKDVDEGNVNIEEIAENPKDGINNIRTNYAVYDENKKTEDFHKKIIRYSKPTDEEKKEGESK